MSNRAELSWDSSFQTGNISHWMIIHLFSVHRQHWVLLYRYIWQECDHAFIHLFRSWLHFADQCMLEEYVHPLRSQRVTPNRSNPPLPKPESKFPFMIQACRCQRWCICLKALCSNSRTDSKFNQQISYESNLAWSEAVAKGLLRWSSMSPCW